MSSSTIPLAQQVKLQAWQHCLRNLSQEEIQIILLIAIRQIIPTDCFEGELKLQSLEDYVRSLSKEQAEDILLRSIRSHLL